MQLQEQVISLEQAKKLKELWFSKEAENKWCWNWWYYNEDGSKWYFVWCKLQRDCPPVFERYPEEYNAYTASELMDILPAVMSVDDEENEDFVRRYKFFITKHEKEEIKYQAGYQEEWETDDVSDFDSTHYGNNLAKTLWDVLIYLLENNLLPTTTNKT